MYFSIAMTDDFHESFFFMIFLNHSETFYAYMCTRTFFKERDESRDPVSCFLEAISMRKCTLKKDLFIRLGPKGTVKAKTFAAAEVKKKIGVCVLPLTTFPGHDVFFMVNNNALLDERKRKFIE